MSTPLENPLSRALTFLRRNETYNSATKEFFGSIVPHLAMVMNRFEFYDQAIVQLSNFGTVFGVNNLLSKGWDTATKGLQQSLGASGKPWLDVAKSVFLYGNIASMVSGSPGLRNGLMVRIAKTTDFVTMVGLNGQQQDDPETIRQVSNQNLARFAKIYATGLGITAGLTGLALLAATRKLPLPKLVQLAHRHLGLPGGDYSKMPANAVIAFWALPCYAGFYRFSRDKVEVKETVAKAAGFAFAFAILPKTIEKAMLGYWKGKSAGVLGPGENAAFLGQVLSGCLFYASIPTVMNLLFRKKRAAAEGLLSTQGAKPSEGAPPPFQPEQSPLDTGMSNPFATLSKAGVPNLPPVMPVRFLKVPPPGVLTAYPPIPVRV